MSTIHRSHWLEREDFGDVTVVRLKMPTAVDEDSIRNDFGMIYTLVSEIGRNRLILNLAQVEFLPSMGIGKLVMLNRMVQAAGGRLAVCQLTAAVADVLKTTHIDHLFEVYDTEKEALQSFAEGTTEPSPTARE